MYPGEVDAEGRETSKSGLQMRLRREHFRQGVLVLRCISTILHMYRRSAQTTIIDADHIQSSPRESASTAGKWRGRLGLRRCRRLPVLAARLVLVYTACRKCLSTFPLAHRERWRKSLGLQCPRKTKGFPFPQVPVPPRSSVSCCYSCCC